MINRDFNKIYKLINNNKNPEFYHAARGSHPGSKWQIKTILPNTEISTDSSNKIIIFWKKISRKYPNIIKITPIAYDWNGKVIENWSTIWLDSKHDVIISINDQQEIQHQIVDFDIGLKLSIHNYEKNNFSKKFLNSCLYYIINFIKNLTTNADAIKNRKKIKVIDNGNFHIKTDN